MEFVYLSINHHHPAAGDTGLIAKVTQHQVFPDGRAIIEATLVRACLIWSYWTEEGSGGLVYCHCTVPKCVPIFNISRFELFEMFANFSKVRSFLRTSTNRKYVVHTQKGFLNVHSDPDDPFDTGNVVFQLQDGDVVTLDPSAPNLGEPPFFWTKICEPVNGYVVSLTGTFEWLEPEEVKVHSRVKLSFTSFCAIALGMKKELDNLRGVLAESVTEGQLRLETVAVEKSVSLSFICKELDFILENEDLLSKYLVGLKIQEAFGLWLGSQAKICQLPEEKARMRKGRVLAIEWQEQYKRETFDQMYRENWERMVESPDGDLQKHPHFVVIEAGESRLKAHQKMCYVKLEEAKKVLRRASIDLHYEALKLLFIAARDENTLFYTLPEEVSLKIAHFIAPHAFGLAITQTGNEEDE